MKNKIKTTGPLKARHTERLIMQSFAQSPIEGAGFEPESLKSLASLVWSQRRLIIQSQVKIPKSFLAEQIRRRLQRIATINKIIGTVEF